MLIRAMFTLITREFTPPCDNDMGWIRRLGGFNLFNSRISLTMKDGCLANCTTDEECCDTTIQSQWGPNDKWPDW